MTMRFVGGVLLVAGLLAAAAQPAAAQPITGYVLTVPLFSGSTALSDSNASNFNRFRLSTEQALGPLVFEAAYEHAVTFQQNITALSLGLGGLADIQSGGEWLDLQGTISRHDQEHVLWRHRFDRLNVAWSPAEAMELSVGRQAISWGTTQVFTPADPFPAFSPTDPFQVFRAGVDAARLRIYPSALSEIDVVFRPSRTDVGEEVTALARGFATWKNWGLSAWGGTLYGDSAGAVGASGGIGPWAINFEAVVRDYHGTVVGRASIGTFRLFQVSDRDLTIVAEYQRDGRGADGPDELLTVLQSREFRRGEYQVFGRDEVAVTAAYQIHPLWSVTGTTIWNLNDRSALVFPGFSYSVSNEASLAGGVFTGTGAGDFVPGQPLPSIYGLAGLTGYLSLTWYF
ncbi:MAG: hypothetical protein OXG04_05810 [Acidobacteria bacterium]|nr:hypothetical protein [Acidobacteriota bacterium]